MVLFFSCLFVFCFWLPREGLRIAQVTSKFGVTSESRDFLHVVPKNGCKRYDMDPSHSIPEIVVFSVIFGCT